MVDATDAIRVLNIGLALYVLVQAARPRAVTWWRTQEPEVRFLLLGAVGIVAATGWATAELLAQQIPFGPRILFLAISLAWIAAGMHLLHRRLRKDPR